VRARRYRFGGGVAGNVAAKTITSLEAVIPFVESVTNLRPGTDGEDAESLESAKSRAPREIKSRSRAVTPDDFEFLAIQTPGAKIRRAKALPLHHPQFEPHRPAGAGLEATLVPVPGVVTVLVVSESKNPLPVAREETLRDVKRQLDAHRLATTEIYVAPARYRKIEVDVRVVAMPNADLDIVQRALNDRLLAYFHPLTGGEKGTGWEFGQTVYFSETYRQILTSQGVLRLEADALKTYIDDVEQPPCQDIPLRPDELVWSDSHRIEVRYT
jgi:predicted phage baseplate assembly protein